MLNNLVHLAKALAPAEGINTTHLPEVEIYRFSTTDTPPLYSTFPASITLTLQGQKEIICGAQSHRYDAGEAALIALDMPLSARITQASPAAPYLCVHIALDPAELGRAAAANPPPAPHGEPAALGIFTADHGLMDNVRRLLELPEQPELLPQLLPLMRQEIGIRLLHHPPSRALLHALLAGGRPGRKIARAVALLKQNMCAKVAIDTLAAELHMSPTAFRQHFKQVVGLSPLQYQKQLRLQAARQLLQSGKLTAAEAAVRVGYESPSQFSREYRRHFGNPPVADMPDAPTGLGAGR